MSYINQSMQNTSLFGMEGTTPYDNFSTPEQLMPTWGYIAASVVLFLIGFIGFFLNLFVVVLMFLERQLWTPINMIVFNLVTADFLVSILGNPFTLISALCRTWIFGEYMCVLYGFFMALFGITSITTLTVLAFERFVMVTRPLSSAHLTHRGACIVIVSIWLYALALTTPPLFGWGKYVNEAANISCSVNWSHRTFNALTYILFLFTFGQIVPTIVISFSYYKILRAIRKNSRRLGRVGRAEHKVTQMVLMMIVAFVFAWTPYSAFALIEQFGKEGTIPPGVAVIPALVAKSSICYDPIIYILMNTQYRQAIRRYMDRHTSSGVSQTERQNVNTVQTAAQGPRRPTQPSTCSVPVTTERITVTPELHHVDGPPSGLASIPEVPAEDTCQEMQESNTAESRSSEAPAGPSRSGSSHSPVLTILESDKLLFKVKPDRVPRPLRETEYRNEGFEDLELGETSSQGMRGSHSMEFSRPQSPESKANGNQFKDDYL